MSLRLGGQDLGKLKSSFLRDWIGLREDGSGGVAQPGQTIIATTQRPAEISSAVFVLERMSGDGTQRAQMVFRVTGYRRFSTLSSQSSSCGVVPQAQQ